jgi:lysophospholipase L1-like esterase
MHGTARQFQEMNKQILVWAIILILSVSLIFALAEKSARNSLSQFRGGYPAGMYVPDDELGFAYKKDFSGSFPGVYGNISIKINSAGFRDYERAEGKSDKIRILAVGDSVTFGAGVSLEDSYPFQLENEINKISGLNENFEVFNLGVDSYGFTQEKILAQRQSLAYKPDIILIGFVLNDINEFSREKAASEKLGMPFCASCNNAKMIFRSDYAFDYFSALYNEWKNFDFEKIKSGIAGLSSFCAENNITLIFAVFPYKEQFDNTGKDLFMPQRILENELSASNIHYVDLKDALMNCSDCYLPHDSVHLNEKGNLKVAEVISEFINKNLMH